MLLPQKIRGSGTDHRGIHILRGWPDGGRHVLRPSLPFTTLESLIVAAITLTANMSEVEKSQAVTYEKPLAHDVYLEDDPHRAALEDNPDKPEKLTWQTTLSIFVSIPEPL